MTSRQRLSVIVPVYNEENNIQPFYQALAPVLGQVDVEWEILFIDDGSVDRTYDRVRGLADKDRRVRCVRFSRNFGTHAAYMAGFHWASGDAAVMISVDLQDPPSLIPQFVSRWREGYEVVWAVREGRDDPYFKKLFASAFYTLFRKIALPAYPRTGMDCGLFDRRILDQMRELHEVNHFFPGMIVWLGFRVATLPYKRLARRAGESKWPLGKRVKNAMDAIVSFSYTPLRLMIYVGLGVLLLSVVCGIGMITRGFSDGFGGGGWPMVLVAVVFIGGLQMLMLGILGEYIWRGTEQTRGRPQYVVMEKLGYSEGDGEPGSGKS